ncbi:hypothetical protein ANTQUA_LOCUS5080 [Anthophora quadrimaculata]
MNTFAENPLFFFMDNISPIVSVKAAKDARKIVELSDTGCDARLSYMPKILRNTNRYYTPKLSKMKPNEDWKSHCEETTVNKSHEERVRAQHEYDKRDSGKFYFIPSNDETNQQYWTSHPQYENTINDAQVRKRSDETKEARSKLKSPTTERTRTRRWEQENNPYEISSTPYHYNRVNTPQIVPNGTRYIAKDHQFRSFPKGQNINDRNSSYSCYNYPNVDQKVNYENVFPNQERMKAMNQNHPEYFKPREIPQDSSSCYKKYCQKSNVSTFEDTENFNNDETTQKDQRYSRYHSRNTRNVSSAKSNGIPRDYDETIPSRIRSRTCSPPIDRSKGTRSSPKGYYENVDQFEDRYDTEILGESDSRCTSGKNKSSREKNVHSNDSMKRIEQLVDRAVDKDSLSDIPNICTSTELLSGLSIATDTSTNANKMCNVRSSFWEFIPLYEEKNQKKCKEMNGNEEMCKRVPLAKRSLNDSNSNSRTKRRPVGKTVADQKVTRVRDSYDNSKPLINLQSEEETTNNNRNFRSKTVDGEQSSERTMNSTETKRYFNEGNYTTGANINENRKVSDRLKGQSESKSQTRIASNFHLGWINGSNRLPKRPNSAPKAECSGDKKKKIENKRDALNVTIQQKARTIMEKTEECLKRRFDKSKIEEDSKTSSKLCNVNKEKKIGSEGSSISKLPIRIGNRYKSRKPNAQRFRLNVKPRVLKGEIKGTKMEELPGDSCGETSSARSRTKPRIKPSVIHNRVVIDSLETFSDCKSTENTQSVADTRNYFQDNTKEKNKLMKNQVEENLGNHVNIDTDSSKLTFSRNEKLNVNIENGRVDDLTFLNMKENQRKRNIANGNCGQETSQMNNLTKDMITGIWKNGLKEKCFFHLNEEDNIICNSYCNKDPKSQNYFHVTKSAAVRTQF